MNVKNIEGIGPAKAKKLAKAGIRTTQGLLKAAAKASGRRNLAAQTGIDEKELLGWANRADLMRVKGVGEEYSDLLEVAGVDTIKELRNHNPANLHKAMMAAQDQKNLVRRPPSLSMVEGWVQQAKSLDPMISY